jgi:capsular exopolysaccharide synthesis family protein
MQNNEIQFDEDDIHIKEIFFNLYEYKWMILFCVFLFGSVGSYYAYFLPNIYRSTASVKVGLDQEAYAKDVISMAMGKGAVNASTEKDLITSRYLSQKALEMVDFREHYYAFNDYKEEELYKKSPIKVILTKGYGLSFTLLPIDAKRFELRLENQYNEDGEELNYQKVHFYNQHINHKDFSLTVEKIKKLTHEKYRFVIDEERRAFGNIFVAQHSKNSTILQISVEDTVALRAKEYANALAQAYVNQNVENKTREAKQRLAFINNQLSTMGLNLKESSSKLEKFRKESKLVNIENKMELISEKLNRYEEELINLTIKEEMLLNFKAQLKKNIKMETLSVEGIGEKDSLLSDRMKELQSAIVEQRLLRQDYTNLHPLVIKVNAKVKQLKNNIKSTVDNLILNHQKRKRLLASNIEKAKIFLNTLPKNERTYGQLERKFKMNEELNTYLLKQKAEAEMIHASTVSKNRVIDRALCPTAPIKPKRLVFVMMGLLLGLILGVVLAFIRMAFDTKIKNENDIMALVAYPILGTIPHFDSNEHGWKGKIKVFEAVKSSMAEAFRHLRSNIQFLDNQHNTQIILLTSTVGQEGKTTVSVNLAAIMSLAKKKTIVINLDMRKPTLHEKFDLPNHIGLSELLNERVSLDDVIQPTRYDHLDILSSGAIPPNPSELIQSKKMYDILESLKKRYEIIILDTPPIGLVTDAKELMHYVDVNIYIVRADYSKKEFLENLKKLDFIDKISHFGILINDVKLHKNNYGYYHRYGYGYYEEK